MAGMREQSRVVAVAEEGAVVRTIVNAVPGRAVDVRYRGAIALCGLLCLVNGCAAKVSPRIVGPMALPEVRVYAATLQKSVRRADAAEYLPIRAGWVNPTISDDLDKTYITLGDRSERRETTVLQLAKDLASLPPSTWPLGRVVVFLRSKRTFSLIPLAGMPTPPIESDPRVVDADRRSGIILAILKQLDVEVVAPPM
jgi:hypothetical protein